MSRHEQLRPIDRVCFRAAPTTLQPACAVAARAVGCVVAWRRVWVVSDNPDGVTCDGYQRVIRGQQNGHTGPTVP